MGDGNSESEECYEEKAPIHPFVAGHVPEPAAHIGAGTAIDRQ